MAFRKRLLLLIYGEVRNTTMSKIYGYCRISTKKQSIDRQVRNVEKAFPSAIIIKETYTGTKYQGRKKLEQIIKIVKEGDRIVFDSVSRMSRNTEEGYKLYKELYEKGIELDFLKEPMIDTSVYKENLSKQISVDLKTEDKAASNLVSGIIEALNKYTMHLVEEQIRLAFIQSEKEVLDLKQRTKEGIETARLAGKQIGQVEGKNLHVKKAEEAKKKMLDLCKDFGGNNTDMEVIKITGVTKKTFYKYKKKLKEECSVNG